MRQSDIRPGALYVGRTGRPRLVRRLAWPNYSPPGTCCVVYTHVPGNAGEAGERDCTRAAFAGWARREVGCVRQDPGCGLCGAPLLHEDGRAAAGVVGQPAGDERGGGAAASEGVAR